MQESCDKLFQPGLVAEVTKLTIILDLLRVFKIKMIFDLSKVSKLTKMYELLKQWNGLIQNIYIFSYGGATNIQFEKQVHLLKSMP